MYQAIEVKYLSVTTHRPARLKAFCQAGSITRSRQWDNLVKEQCSVAAELAHKMGWGGRWVGGYLKNGNAVFVLVSDSVYDGSFRIEDGAFRIEDFVS